MQKYDFTRTDENGQPPLAAADMPEDQESAPDLFEPLQSQLGLKLERKRVPVEVFVVDQMKWTPTAN
jgi:uncharacterized protein (TIGR03435 family)